MSRDLAAGRLPHPLVPAAMGERRVEAVDAVWHAGQIGARGHRLLAGRRLVEAARVALAVPHPLPAELVALIDDLRMVHAEIAVERDGGAVAMTLEHLHQAEHADPVAVIARRPGRNVGR